MVSYTRRHRGGTQYTVSRKNKTNRIYDTVATIIRNTVMQQLTSTSSKTSSKTPSIPLVNNTYLDNTSLTEPLKTHLVSKLIERIKNVNGTSTQINLAFDSVSKNTYDWVTCDKNCVSILSSLFNAEIKSTAYIIRALSASVLSADPNTDLKTALTFTVPPAYIKDLTGEWIHDSPYITMKFTKANTNERLIMGFGPSAAGKTHWAKTIISLFSKADTTFPTTFLSIDGGIYREQSIVYTTVVETAIRYNLKGLSNLVVSGELTNQIAHKTPGIGSGSLFDSDIVKNTVIDYLQKTEKKYSLYVPETLGWCGVSTYAKISDKCDEKYNKFITISGDKASWNAILIWQHNTSKECDYSEQYKCEGCVKSGKIREIQEGKKYSDSAYDAAIKNGLANMNRAPGIRLKIHNCGSLNRISIIEDFTESANKIISVLNDDKNKCAYKYKFCRRICMKHELESSLCESNTLQLHNAFQLFMKQYKILDDWLRIHFTKRVDNVYTRTQFVPIITKMKELSRKNVSPNDLQGLIGMLDITFKNSNMQAEIYIKTKMQSFIDSYKTYFIRLQNNQPPRIPLPAPVPVQGPLPAPQQILKNLGNKTGTTPPLLLSNLQRTNPAISTLNVSKLQVQSTTQPGFQSIRKQIKKAANNKLEAEEVAKKAAEAAAEAAAARRKEAAEAAAARRKAAAEAAAAIRKAAAEEEKTRKEAEEAEAARKEIEEAEKAAAAAARRQQQAKELTNAAQTATKIQHNNGRVGISAPPPRK